jgi:hypothetical protein
MSFVLVLVHGFYLVSKKPIWFPQVFVRTAEPLENGGAEQDGGYERAASLPV